MKILLVHPEDDPEKGPWADRSWDQVVDLGMGGVETYERWNRRFRCPITSFLSTKHGFEDLHRVRDLLARGYGQLLDEHGLDWWEIMSILLHGELEMLVLFQRFALTVGPEDEIGITRPGIHANLLQSLLPAPVRVFPLRRGAKRTGIRHYLRLSNKLSLSQMIDVFFDKYDPGYQIRGRLNRERRTAGQPAVLLPTAYVNVSRTGIAYANTFPEENFLLVTTRRSGWLRNLPRNVKAAWLSSFAAVQDYSDENSEIEGRWQILRKELINQKEFEILDRLGFLSPFARWIRHGLEVRGAWRNVLDTEPIEAVLCADDSNPYTRIPLLLAKARGLPNIACHHGALDGRYVFKRSYGDVIWVKGKMEKDYLARKCGVPLERLEICAPAPPANFSTPDLSRSEKFQPYIIVFSEASDVTGGRQEEFYRDILPPLADLARMTGRTLVLKLHPVESKHERAAALKRILSREQSDVTTLMTGPLTENLFAQAWFGITIHSTVATECAVRGIPCFLCTWLEFWPYGYVEQFIRFGVGTGLNHPSEIKRIPEYLANNVVSEDACENCWQPAAAGRLRQWLTTSRKTYTNAIG